MGLITKILAERQLLGDMSESSITQMLASQDFSENGFQFRNFERAVRGDEYTFSVPRQDFEKWYQENSHPNPEKQQKAEEISKLYGLELACPPDFYIGAHKIVLAEDRHHTEFLIRDEEGFPVSIATAHPRYIQILNPNFPCDLNLDNLFEDICRMYDV